jgi:hypothetical protein
MNVAGIATDQMIFRVYVHESADTSAAERFWREVTHAHADRFRRPTLKRHNPRTVRRNVGATITGAFALTSGVVPGSTGRSKAGPRLPWQESLVRPTKPAQPRGWSSGLTGRRELPRSEPFGTRVSVRRSVSLVRGLATGYDLSP